MRVQVLSTRAISASFLVLEGRDYGSSKLKNAIAISASNNFRTFEGFEGAGNFREARSFSGKGCDRY